MMTEFYLALTATAMVNAAWMLARACKTVTKVWRLPICPAHLLNDHSFSDTAMDELLTDLHAFQVNWSFSSMFVMLPSSLRQKEVTDLDALEVVVKKKTTSHRIKLKDVHCWIDPLIYFASCISSSSSSYMAWSCRQDDNTHQNHSVLVSLFSHAYLQTYRDIFWTAVGTSRWQIQRRHQQWWCWVAKGDVFLSCHASCIKKP